MDDFSKHGNQELFHYNNEKSSDKGVVVSVSPPLQYHQPRCPVELNLDHLPQYIDHHHFVQQQDHVQPPTGALEDHRQLDKHVIAQIIQPIVKTNPIISIKMLITETKTFMNYISSYKKAWLAKQRALEMIHGNWEESYAKLPNVLGALQSCVSRTMVFEEGEMIPAKNVSFGHLVHAQMDLHIAPIVQVDDTWY
ncbi:hypothetical protein HKD37_19G053616 [Glycine soja]